MSRRILHTVHIGSTHGPSHNIVSRLLHGPTLPSYDAAGARLTSSLNTIINRRVGLERDMRPVLPRPGDIVAPFSTRFRKYLDNDPRRLP